MSQELSFKLARNAIEYLIKTYSIAEINIPYYLCNVVRHIIVKNKCKPVFYHIDDSFMPDKIFSKDEFIIYPNYFGICNYNVEVLAQKYPKLIVDNAHAYYAPPKGFACFNAGHKFGYTDSKLWINPENMTVQKDRKFYKRQECFQNLTKIYNKTNKLIIRDKNIAPFVYPYLAETVEDADKLVLSLKEKGKTVYRYWSLLPQSYNEYKFYSRLVPIQIDETVLP